MLSCWRAPGNPYVSVYDSDNAKLDSGELKDLALAASKALKTAAVFTSLYDSDTYEFIVFANGRQVDLLMTDAESYDGPMKRLSDKSRAAKWSSLFGRTLSIDQIKQTVTKQTAFADGIIAGLSELIGLRGGQPQMNYQDFLDGGEEITAQLYFKRKPKAVSEIPAGEIRLANGFDPDDTPNASGLSGKLADSRWQTSKCEMDDLESGRRLQWRNGDHSRFRAGWACFIEGRDERL